MDDIMNTLSQVLNDPQSMAQINRLAQSLSQGNSPPSAQPMQQSQPAPEQSGSQGSPDISSMLSSLFSGQNSSPAPPVQPPSNNPGGIDTAKLMQVVGALSQSGANDKNVALLLSLKPLLRDENQVKIDRIIKIFKLMAAYPLLRDSGILGELGGDLFG